MQDNLLHAAKPFDEEGTNIVVLENEGGTSSSSGDSSPASRMVTNLVHIGHNACILKS